MNKKIFIFLSTIVFIVIIVIVGGYYFYKNPIDNNQENNNTNGLINEECEGNECTESKNFIDVVFKKTENDLLYFKPKNSSEIKSIKMSENVVFVEVILSENYDIIEEKNITLADFNEGDEVSIFVDIDNKVNFLKRITIEGKIIGDAVDGSFVKIEDNNLYIQLKDNDEIKSIKMSENVVFVEVILSENYDIIEEKNITLADFNEGDSVSAFINDLNRDKVSKLSRIIVSDLESN